MGKTEIYDDESVGEQQESKNKKCDYFPSGSFFRTPIILEDQYLSLISGNALKVFTVFLRCLNTSRNGLDVWPSYKHIMEKTGIGSETTISNAILELAKNGLVTDIKKSFSKGNRYTIATTEPKPNKDLIIKMETERKKRSSSAKNVIKKDAWDD